MRADTRTRYEQFVVDPETAQRLKTVGYPQDTLFYWVINPQLDTTHLFHSGVDMEYLGPKEYIYPAPNAGEIRERLPNEVWITLKTRSIIRRPGTFYFIKHNGIYVVSLMVKGETGQLYEFHREEDANEAVATGKMYLFVHEQHLHELHT